MTEVLRVRHHFAASADPVFDAFLDVETASQFLFATPTGQMVRAELDPRVGGHFLFVDRRAGTDVEHVGSFVELARPTRVAFEFSVPAFSPLVTRVTVDIVAAGTGCDVTLSHEGVPPEVAERSGKGWQKILQSLERVLAG